MYLFELRISLLQYDDCYQAVRGNVLKFQNYLGIITCISYQEAHLHQYFSKWKGQELSLINIFVDRITNNCFTKTIIVGVIQK